MRIGKGIGSLAAAAAMLCAVPTADALTRRVQANGGLNLRTGPGFGYRVIRVLANGTLVQTVSLSGPWCKISAPAAGWVYFSYLSAPITSGGGTTSSGSQTYGSHPAGDPAVARAIYNEALRYGASEKVKVAMFEAAIVESGVRNLRYGDRDSIGVFQLRTGIWGWTRAASVTLSAQWFLGRAIARQNWYSTSGRLAQAVEVSAYPYRYDQEYYRAKAWLRYLRGY